MKNSVIVSILCLLFLSCYSQTSKINGVSFVASPDKINKTNITPIQKVSANYVALMPFGFIKSLKSPRVNYNSKRQWFGETPKGIEQYASELKKEQIKVMLKPQIWVWHGEYTGFIEMNSEADWQVLETSYEKFILQFAELAETINAEVFCLGTELEKFVALRPAFWTSLIKKIRKVYNGKLTYAANWDEFKRVSFWNELDYIGIDAYFPVSDEKSPTVADFENGWKTHKEQIKAIHTKFKKPILFTEFGYRSINYTGKEPWASSREKGNINLKAQENGLKAIYNQFWNEDWFAGGFIWKWFHNHKESGGENNNRFTPQNKPAEKLLKQLYEKQ